MTKIDETAYQAQEDARLAAGVSEKEASALLSLTPAAATRIQDLLEDEIQPMLFRVYITGGGCAGFQYGFSFDKAMKPDDVKITQTLAEGKTIEAVIDPLSLMYLAGAQIDYQEGLQGSYFKVTNPNAKTTCGCGSSFSI